MKIKDIKQSKIDFRESYRLKKGNIYGYKKTKEFKELDRIQKLVKSGLTKRQKRYYQDKIKEQLKSYNFDFEDVRTYILTEGQPHHLVLSYGKTFRIIEDELYLFYKKGYAVTLYYDGEYFAGLTNIQIKLKLIYQELNRLQITLSLSGIPLRVSVYINNKTKEYRLRIEKIV